MSSGIEESPYEGERHRVWEGADDNQLIERDYTKCISCGRCVRICHEVQGCNVYGYTDRGFEAIPNTPYAASLKDSGCEFCGQCVSTCPVGRAHRQAQPVSRPTLGNRRGRVDVRVLRCRLHDRPIE